MTEADGASRQEADQLESHLRRLAGRWRQKLKDPAVRKLVKGGQLQVSPLVRELLKAFPREGGPTPAPPPPSPK